MELEEGGCRFERF